MAGLIDGEGTIYVQRRRVRSKATGEWFNRRFHRLFVSISNTDKKMIQWIVHIYGGHVAWNKPNGLRSRRIHQWCVSGRDALHILSLVAPYLVSKKRQAGLALRLEKREDGHRVSSREFARRERIAVRISALNVRGLKKIA